MGEERWALIYRREIPEELKALEVFKVRSKPSRFVFRIIDDGLVSEFPLSPEEVKELIREVEAGDT